MRALVLSVGRLKSGPERDLVDRYLDRAAKAGRGVGLTRVEVRELDESRAARADDRKAEEATAILAEVPAAAAVVALDERGRTLTSPDLAERLGAFRDAGRDLALVVGGPDGLGEAVRARADLVLAFGAMTWPHQLVRLMLAEQLYRVVTIWSGHPYHRA